ncbi:Hypothetical protein R9X50_00662700 [Acrodontium crateriforme]|uniref:L-serine ammonia-lyase n=1 Tax=Acrodontium crateriforme TaxID=150365 RepID=A0AAQ3M983_9PEZI|nr:Hypothetical protein R9X50_00662700 [Acrodontium crateriforme]
MAQDKKKQGSRKPWRKTPLIESANLSKAAGCRIFMKLEHLQPGGSFKSRGIGNYVVESLARAENPENVHFYSCSGGNAGIAAVHAANFVGRPSTVVVPMSTKPMMINKIMSAGASEVIQQGASLREAMQYMVDTVIPDASARGQEPIYVMPFDHPDIWAGNGTVVPEIAEQMEELGEDAPDVIVCSVGGGGLMNGIFDGIEAQGTNANWDHCQVLATETKGADSMDLCLQKGEMDALPAITSQATSLGVAKISERTFELATKHIKSGKLKNVVLTDSEAAMGCWRFADDERISVELACGVNMALCYGGRLKRALGRPVRPDEKVVIVVCGGQNVNMNMMEVWRQEIGTLDEVETSTPAFDIPATSAPSYAVQPPNVMAGPNSNDALASSVLVH